MLTQQIAAWQESKRGRNPATLEEQLFALETQLANLQVKYADDYPDASNTKNNIAALQKTIAGSDNERKEGGSDKNPDVRVESMQITLLRVQLHAYCQATAQNS